MKIPGIFRKKDGSGIKTFKHSGNLGDIIFSLPTIIALGGGKLYLSNNTPGIETRVFTDKSLEQMIELLKTQPYLADVRRYNNEHIDYNLDKFREIFACYDHIARWHLKAFSVDFDLSRPWLENIRPIKTAEIVVNNTFRDRDVPLNWNILEGLEERCVFAGLEHEYEKFRNVIGLKIPWHPTKDLLEYARVIKGARLFIGNQSLGFALAEAMKVPRILEVHHHCPSCLPLS
ncbi:MAG: hypothetical protein PHT32_07595, partial [Candidatus Omnitrophica bacterium]|nr:hypothetical protein [Candidatus Omnitrophota bacterium]